MNILDLYQNLFGKNHITDGNVIDMAEHGRVGGVSTGQGFKYSQLVNVDEQDPLQINGDSVYSQDINVTASTKVGWTGDFTSLFDCPADPTEMYNDTATNPKILYVVFHRTLYLSSVGMGCNTGKKFSNLKMEFIGSDGTVRSTFDDSNNNTTFGTKLYSFAPTACIGIRFSFYTASTVGISNITIQKENKIVSRLQGLKPDGTVADLAATQGGNLRIAINDDYGFGVENTPLDELRTIIPVKLVGATFTGTTVDPNFWTVANANSGSTAQANGQIVLSTNTTASGATSITSVRSARYTGGSSNRMRCVVQLGDTGVTNNSRKWGMFNGTDGAYYELDGTTLYAVTYKTSTPTRVAIANWNGNTTSPVLTDANTYEIYITNSRVYFTINGVMKHTMTASTTTWSDHINLNAKISNTNTTINTNQTITCRVLTIYRLGNLATQPTYKYQSGQTAGVICKYGAGNLHGLSISGVQNNSVITLYDNTAASGTVIWSSGTMGAQTQPFGIELHDIPFSIGLTMVISGADSIVTLIYE